MELLLRGLLPLEAQRHPLQQIDHRIQSGVLIIGRTLARREPRLRLGGDMLLEHLYQARFTDTGFPAEEHDLAQALLDLPPALEEYPDFLLPPHQRGPPGAAGGFQATTGHTLIQHTIDR